MESKRVRCCCSPELPGHEAVDDEVDAAVERQAEVGDRPRHQRPQLDGEAAGFPQPLVVLLQGEELVHPGRVAQEEEEADREEDAGVARRLCLEGRGLRVDEALLLRDCTVVPAAANSTSRCSPGQWTWWATPLWVLVLLT